jgi:hypothetical protein
LIRNNDETYREQVVAEMVSDVTEAAQCLMKRNYQMNVGCIITNAAKLARDVTLAITDFKANKTDKGFTDVEAAV